MCIIGFVQSVYHIYFKFDSQKQILSAVEQVCPLLVEFEEQCKTLVGSYGNLVLEVLVNLVVSILINMLHLLQHF